MRWRSGPGALALTLLLAGCLAVPASPTPPAFAVATPGAPDGDCLRTTHGVDLQRATIAQLQAALAAGVLTSVDLVAAYEARIAAYDNAGPEVNSVQVVHPEARAIAAALDAQRAAGQSKGPLHGIPVLLKDNVGTLDLPTTAGSIALAGNLPPADATLTARLRDAGAIILGKAQLSEFANWMSLTMPSGYSSLGGQVINAYTGGNPSGSSSGSGVAGSMAMAAGTIGTETSGSILSPSIANSLVGLKPTTGLVSRAGVIPLAASFDTPGPMVRNVRDAALMLGAIAGPDPLDPATAASEPHLPPGNDYAAGLRVDALQGVRLGVEPNANPLYRRALDDLAALGAVLVPIESEQARSASLLEIGLIPNEFKQGINDYLARLAGPGLPVETLTDIIVFNTQHPDEVQYGQDLLIASDATPGLRPLADAAAIPVIAANRAIADRLFERYGIEAVVGFGAPYTGLGAAAGYPTIVVPTGYDDTTPRGLSFFGPAWSEARLLAYAYAYEQGSMRRETPTVINPSLLEGVCPAGASEAPGAAGRAAAPTALREPVERAVEVLDSFRARPTPP